MVSTHIRAISKHVSSSLVAEDPDIQVDLGHLDRVRGRTVEVEAFIVFVTVALRGVGHVVPGLGLHVGAVPAGRELDVDLQLWSVGGERREEERREYYSPLQAPTGRKPC